MMPNDLLAKVDVLVDTALTWAQAHLGETRYATWCLSFVEDAFERGNNIELDGYATAKEAADGYGARDDGNVPPAGALAFYDWHGDINGIDKNWGHVGLALGDGRVIHALAEVRIDDYRDVVALLPPHASHSARYIGWASASAVLKRSKLRIWDR